MFWIILGLLPDFFCFDYAFKPYFFSFFAPSGVSRKTPECNFTTRSRQSHSAHHKVNKTCLLLIKFCTQLCILPSARGPARYSFHLDPPSHHTWRVVLALFTDPLSFFSSQSSLAMVFWYYAPATKVAVVCMAHQNYSCNKIHTALGKCFSNQSFRRWNYI